MTGSLALPVTVTLRGILCLFKSMPWYNPEFWKNVYFVQVYVTRDWFNIKHLGTAKRIYGELEFFSSINEIFVNVEWFIHHFKTSLLFDDINPDKDFCPFDCVNIWGFHENNSLMLARFNFSSILIFCNWLVQASTKYSHRCPK